MIGGTTRALITRLGQWIAALVIPGCATTSPPDYVSDSECCHNHLAGFSAKASDNVFYRPDAQPYFAFTRLQADFDPQTLSPEAELSGGAGSADLKRFVLWPFGVKSPGALRRNGAHTIAFVGKRHFSGPDLFEAVLTDPQRPAPS